MLYVKDCKYATAMLSQKIVTCFLLLEVILGQKKNPGNSRDFPGPLLKFPFPGNCKMGGKLETLVWTKTQVFTKTQTVFFCKTQVFDAFAGRSV